MAEQSNDLAALQQRVAGLESRLPAPRDERAEFIASRIGGLPAVYTDQLGADPARWPAEADRITRQYRVDFGKATPEELTRYAVENPGARLAEPAPQQRAPTASELIMQGLSQSKPGRAGQ